MFLGDEFYSLTFIYIYIYIYIHLMMNSSKINVLRKFMQWVDCGEDSSIF